MENIPLSNTPDSATDSYFPIASSKSDTLSASFSEAFQNTAISSLANLGVKKYIELSGKGTMVPPEELNKQYPFMDEPFQQPTNSEVAAFMAWSKTESMKRQEVMANGDTAPRVLGSVIGTLADPIGLAAAYVTGGASEAVLAKSGASAALEGLAARGAVAAEAASATQTFGKALVGGVAAQAVTEPIVALNKHEMQQEYSLKDAIQNIAMGAALEGGAVYLGGKFLRFLKGKGPEAEKAAFSTAIAQKLQGKKVDVESMGQMLAREDGGLAAKSPPLPGEDFHYSVTQGNNPEFKTASQKPMFDNVFDGVHTTDNESAALAQASNSTLDGVGVVNKLRIDPSAKLLNLDELLPEDLGRKIFSSLEKIYGKDAQVVAQNVDAKTIFSDLKDSVQNGSITKAEFDGIQNTIKESGFDGVHYQANKYMGAEIPSQRTTVLFDKNKAQEVRSYQPSLDNSYKVPKEDIKSFNDRQTSIVSDSDYDEKALRSIEQAPERIEEPGKLTQVSEIDKQIQSYAEQKQFMSPEHQKEFDSIMGSHVIDEEYATATKGLINCLTGASGG